MLDDGERKDRTAMESNDTAAGMPYMDSKNVLVYKKKKGICQYPPAGLTDVRIV